MGINLKTEDVLANCRRNPAEKPLLLYSGGLDSTVLLFELRPALCLFIHYGQRHGEREFEKAYLNCKRLRIPLIEKTVELSGGVASQGDAFITPLRNLIFLGIAANVAVENDCDELWIGCNKTDYDLFPDCRLGFLEYVRHAIQGSGYDLRIEAPLMQVQKKEIGFRAKSIGVEIDDVWSCYRGGDSPCGECVACLSFPSFNPLEGDQERTGKERE